MSRSPLYRLTCVLSLVHLASALASILVYDIEDARDSQFIAILYAINTFYMVYMLIPHTMQKDNDAVSRLNKQFVIINFLLLCWVLSIGMVPLTVNPDIKHTIYECAEARFMSPKCITLGLDMSLPFALIATLGTISYSIYENARAIQALPPPPREPTVAPTPFKLRPAPARVQRNGSTSSNTAAAVDNLV